MEPATMGALSIGSKIAGSIFGGLGARKKAKDIRKALAFNIRETRKFTDAETKRSQELADSKQGYLETGDPFEDMGRFIFGGRSAGTYENLRKSQADFARLSAGDTTGFQKEVASIVSNSLANTFGGPRGSFENLSAKNLLNFRQLGANTAMSMSNYFGQQGQQLISNKFGILDQNFDRQARLRASALDMNNNMRLQRAGMGGASMSMLGNLFNAVGGGLDSFRLQQSNAADLARQQSIQGQFLPIQRQYLERQMQALGGQPASMSPASSYSPLATQQPVSQMPSDLASLDNDWSRAFFGFADAVRPQGTLLQRNSGFASQPVSAYILGAPSVLPPP